MRSDEMSISAFARRSLLSVKALRLYDEMGLLRPERTDATSGYRCYGESQLASARLISLLRKLDVPLARISLILQNPDTRSDLLTDWWEEEEAQFSARRDLLRFIRSGIWEESGGSGDYEIDVRTVPQSTFIARKSHVHGPELPSFIGSATSELVKQAENLGGSKGYPTVVFFGTVDFDSDGPVEVRVSIPDDPHADIGEEIRTEASHSQAFITLQKHQVAFPQILQVYQALRQWIAANGYTVSGPPREIYLEEFVTAAHDSLVCDVAIPIQITGEV